MRPAMLLLLTCGLLTGCAGVGRAEPDHYGPGRTSHTLSSGGITRDYLLYVPDGLPPNAPLVVMLHGGFGSAEQAQRAYGWNQLADTAKFAVAYPDGVNRAWNVNGGCCGKPSREGVDDVAFVAAVVADVRAHMGIDPARIYATGISNGGMMSYALACNTGVFAAIGPVAATALDPCPAPRPTSVAHIHGTDDRLVRYDGQPGMGVARVDGPPIAELNAFWRNVDRCAAPTTAAQGGVSTSTADCPDGRSVVLTTVDGGGHDWPPFATESLWRFFVGHPA